MVATRFNSFVLGLVFIFLALGDSLANKHKGAQAMVMEAGPSPLSMEKVNFDAAESKINGKVGGRKMMEKMVFWKEMEREEGMNIKGGAPEISGAKMGGFMDLTADYHVAKPHPPKNN